MLRTQIIALFFIYLVLHTPQVKAFYGADVFATVDDVLVGAEMANLFRCIVIGESGMRDYPGFRGLVWQVELWETLQRQRGTAYHVPPHIGVPYNAMYQTIQHDLRMDYWPGIPIDVVATSNFVNAMIYEMERAEKVGFTWGGAFRFSVGGLGVATSIISFFNRAVINVRQFFGYIRSQLVLMTLSFTTLMLHKYLYLAHLRDLNGHRRILQENAEEVVKFVETLTQHLEIVTELFADDISNQDNFKFAYSHILSSMFAEIDMTLDSLKLPIGAISLQSSTYWSVEKMEEMILLTLPHSTERERTVLLYLFTASLPILIWEDSTTLADFLSHFLANIHWMIDEKVHRKTEIQYFYSQLYPISKEIDIDKELVWKTAIDLARNAGLQKKQAFIEAFLEFFVENPEKYAAEVEDTDVEQLFIKKVLSFFGDTTGTVGLPPISALEQILAVYHDEKILQELDDLNEAIIMNKTIMELPFLAYSEDDNTFVQCTATRRDDALSMRDQLKMKTDFLTQDNVKEASEIWNSNPDKYQVAYLLGRDLDAPFTFVEKTKLLGKEVTIRPPPSLDSSSSPGYILPVKNFYPSANNPALTVKFNPVFKVFPYVPVELPSMGIPIFVSVITSLAYIFAATSLFIAPTWQAALYTNVMTIWLAAEIADWNSYGYDDGSPRRLLQEKLDFYGDTIDRMDNLTAQEKSLFKHVWFENVILPKQHALENNHTSDNYLTNISAITLTQKNAFEYQNMLKSQFNAMTNDSQAADFAAAQVYQQVQAEQLKLNYKKVLNARDYENKQKDLDENRRRRVLLATGVVAPVYHALRIEEDFGDFLYKVNFQIYDFNQEQWDDLVLQANATIRDYLISQWSKITQTEFLNDQIIYNHWLDEPENRLHVELLNQFSQDENVPSHLNITYHLVSSPVIRKNLTQLVEGTITNTFYTSLKSNNQNLTTSVVEQISTDLATGGGLIGGSAPRPTVASIFTATQTNRSLFNVSCDGSLSYSLWGNTLDYEWSFGDNTSAYKGIGANYQKIQHTYQKAGTYLITLTVSDALGNFATAKSSINVTILYDMVPTIQNGKSYYMGGRNQIWMLFSGNVYEPISSLIGGANQASMFTFTQINSQTNQYQISPGTVNDEPTSNYMGFWNYPSVSTVPLQASSYLGGSVVPDFARWIIEPISNELGYYKIRQGDQYLTIRGDLVKISEYDDNTCAFVLTRNLIKPKEFLKGLRYSMGSNPVSSVQIKNFINSNAVTSIKVTNPNTGNDLWNFIPNGDGSGYYRIADLLNEDFTLSGYGQMNPIKIAQVGKPSVFPNQLWSLNYKDNGVFEIINKVSVDFCLNANIDTIILNKCQIRDADFCYDASRNLLKKSTCATKLDKMCCDPLKLLVPFIGASLYRKSCHRCSSGREYCQSGLDESKYFIKPSGFKANGKCDAITNFYPYNGWFLNRTDATNVQEERNQNIRNYKDMGLKNLNFKNMQYQQYVCKSDNSIFVYLCENPTSKWNIYTISDHAQLDAVGTRGVGYMIQGTGVNSERWLTGAYGEDNEYSFGLTWGETHGHFWHIIPAGYNVYQLRYDWGPSNGQRCLTPMPNDPKSTASRIIFKYEKCDLANRAQLWAFTN